MKKPHILITGLPGVGKTTLVRKLSSRMKSHSPVGFYTEEIREKGERRGFELVSLRGERSILSHVSLHSPYRVGRYGVDLKAFESFLARLSFHETPESPVILDEIGKMECLSTPFKRLLRELFDSDRLLIATIALRGGGIIEEIKGRNDTVLFEVTRENRDTLLPDILEKLGTEIVP